MLENLDGGAGIDSLTLDYSGVMADGRTVTEVYINLRDSKHESIYLSDGTSPTPVFAGFESGNIIGSAGAGDIRGDFRNTQSGGGGDDYLAGGTGVDNLYGGTGRDSLDGSTGGDQLFGGSNVGRIYGGVSVVQ